MDQIKIGKFIQELRKKLNLTQFQLAQKIGVSDKTISKWETGRGMPDLIFLKPLSDFLGITINELLSGEKILDDRLKSKTDENIVNIIISKNKTKRKYKFILLIVSFLLIIIMSISFKPIMIKNGIIPNPSLKYSQKYIANTGNIKGDVDVESFEKISLIFEIGANKYGYAVFKDPDKAFNTLKQKYKKGLKAIQKEFKLFPFSRFNYKSYGTYGWQLTTGTEEELKEAIFITSFVDIYKNSFD